MSVMEEHLKASAAVDEIKWKPLTFTLVEYPQGI